MRAEIESNSTKMRKACVEVTQAFRDFSLLLVEAIASLGQRTRFYHIQVIASCPAVSWAACGISWSRSGLPYFLPSLLPVLIPPGNRTTKARRGVPTKSIPFNVSIGAWEQIPRL